MNIVSYRGPGAAGGVSGTLSRILDDMASEGCTWWYVSGGVLFHYRKPNRVPDYVCDVATEVIQGHYKHCNEFLWPILHDLPHHAKYDAGDHACYDKFNLSLAGNIQYSSRFCREAVFFVNDYQVALVPKLLAGKNQNVTCFWHVPWPVTVENGHVEPLKSIAAGLLGAKKIGFHTQEYAQNFMSFVDEHLPEYMCDFRCSSITRAANNRGVSLHRDFDQLEHVTEVVVKPLGVDSEFWRRRADSCFRPATLTPLRAGEKFILSVDRADYTKGILERISAIDHFFADNPEYLGKVVFVQVCQPTRQSIAQFDRYWRECQERAGLVNSSWRRDEWQPLLWVDKSLGADELAWMYRQCAALFVTPLRDGLNLTSKEFVASSGRNPGVLLLSPGAGVWQELGSYALPVMPAEPQQMSYQLAAALAMPERERAWRSGRMQELLQRNGLMEWWHSFISHRSSAFGLPASERPRGVRRRQVINS